MTTLGERFDRWVASGPFTVIDISIYRILYASLALLTYPRIQYLVEYPGSLFDPPPGPFALIPTLPPLGFLIAVEVATVVSLSLLLIGLWTRIVSLTSAFLLILSFGLTYSFGKIDHTILMVAVPLVLAFSQWGGRFSADSLRVSAAETTVIRQWPLRLLALLVGLGFLTAAAPKVLTGWLSPVTQATQGHFLIKYLFEGKDSWLAPLAYGVRSGWVWEPLDWATVALEALLVVTVIRWNWFRIALAVTCVFHLGVLLLFNISFNTNVMAYGAFVSWGLLLGPSFERVASRIPRSAARVLVPLTALLAVLVALVLPLLIGTGGRLVITTGIVLIGAAISIGYLSTVVVRGFARRRTAVMS